jgi:hypothetical protein
MEKIVKGYTIVKGKKLLLDGGNMGYFGSKKVCNEFIEARNFEETFCVAKAEMTVTIKE